MKSVVPPPSLPETSGATQYLDEVCRYMNNRVRQLEKKISEHPGPDDEEFPEEEMTTGVISPEPEKFKRG